MSKVYLVPPDTNEKEKIIGGKLTLIQFFWLLGGLVLGGIVFAVIYSATKIGGLAIAFGFILALAGTPFAFLKRHDVPLASYIMLKRKFKYKTKLLMNIQTSNQAKYNLNKEQNNK